MRRFLGAGTILACVALLACGGGGGGGAVVTPPVPTFQCSDAPPPVPADQVVLRCGAQIARDVWRIDVVIGVPTTSTDIGGFNFDVVADDATLLAFVAGSGQQGELLGQGGATVLLAAATVPGEPGHLVVGIHRTGGGPGVQGIAGYDRIMSFRMKALMSGPFGPELLRFEKYEATDSSDQLIPGITFSDQLLLSVK